MLPPKSDYLPISKLYSILAVANLPAHNNISPICYCVQINANTECCRFNCSFSVNLKLLGVDNIYFAGDGTCTTYEYIYTYIMRKFLMLAKQMMCRNDAWS